MDACARIRGVPLRARASIRKETVRDSGPQCVKSLLRNKKELCSVNLELQTRDTTKLTEIHFVCLPGHCEGEDVTLQALSSLPGELCELLKSVHVHSLKNDEVLMLKDSRWLAERRDTGTQCWLKVICVLRHGGPTPSPPGSSSCTTQASVSSLVGLLGRYAAGVRYALELQALHSRGGTGAEPGCQPEEDDTNQSVSSIEDDFVTALEHLEEEGDTTAAAPYYHGDKRDIASQTVPAHKRRKDLSGSRVIISSSKKPSTKHRPDGPEVSITVQRSSALESQWTHCNPGICLPSASSANLSDSEDSDGSSPSPIIFLDEVGYQKSLLAKLDIPQVPGGPRERVEDSDSEVSEFFDSFDQFDDDLDELSSECGTLTLPLDAAPSATAAQKRRPSETSASGSKYVSRGCSTKGMNPHRFDQPTLPANVKKPTPLKPGSPYSPHSDVPDSPRPVRTSCEESGGPLFSPVSSSAFSPLGDAGGTGPLEYFWKADGNGGDGSELRKPQDLCSLYKTYSDFANSLSKEILGSVCGYQSPVDISDNKNLSCVCHKEFQNPSGHLMKLSDIQETVTLQQKPQSLKDGIQRFATDLVEMSLGSALRDLQKSVSTCTTTLCHLAARLTSSVFQMAFHEIGMRRAYVLKERAVSGLAGFLVGEAVSGALKEFLVVKKRMFHSTVTSFAADLAEELVFEGIMEVCQFSHPSTPLNPSNWPFGCGLEEEEEEEEEVVTSYASDLSESVLQEAFIELSQADVAFTSQAAISVSLDNIYYVSAEDTTTHTCSATDGQQQVFHSSPAEAAPPPGPSGEEAGCTVKKALITVSGMASCVPVPQAGQALSHIQSAEEVCQCKTSVAHTSQSSPRRSLVVTAASSDTTTATQTDHSSSHDNENQAAEGEPTQGKKPFHNFSGNMVDMIVSEACELITATKMKKGFGDCAEFFTKTIGSRRGSSSRTDAFNDDVPDSPSKTRAGPESFRYDSKDCGSMRKGEVTVQRLTTAPSQSQDGATCEPSSRTRPVVETHPVMIKDTLDVPGSEAGARRKSPAPCGGGGDSSPSSGLKSSGTPGTPPSTPQQPHELSKEKQIRQFSKKLKGKLAKEFSPATPPPTPHYQPEPDPGSKDNTTPEADKADFMLKLMRSLSEEAEGNEEEEEEEVEDDDDGGVVGGARSWETGVGRRPELNLSSCRRMSNKEALHYAERLAYHIVSMATEMDTLGTAGDDGRAGGGGGDEEGRKRRRDSVTAQFSEQTLNTLWVYAGEVAGEVISDVKRMVGSGRQQQQQQPCPHRSRAPRRRSLDSRSECPHYYHHQQLLLPGTEQSSRDSRVGRLAEQWSSALLNSVLHPPSSSPSCSSSSTTITASSSASSSGLSSEYPSCESVTDEYAGYLIRVLKKEGGSRELVLDQYASRLAYRSIKLGLAHAARKIKQRPSAGRFHSSRSLPEEWKATGHEGSIPRDRIGTMGSPSGQEGQCSCGDSEEQSQREYGNLVNFAESLAYNITCDVTRKLRPSSVRLPKSLTDSCLYKKSKLDGMTENLIRNSFSCPLLASKEAKSRHYHSTGSLCDGVYSSGIMQVIEHYARKIVDDTLEMGLASAGHAAREHQRAQGPDRYSHTDRLSEGATLGDRTCRYCQSQECPYCSKPSRHHQHQTGQWRKRAQECASGPERLCGGLEIPKIHIHMDCSAAFAEEMVSTAMETAKRELSNTSLNADSGIGHDGASYAESLTTEIMASALSNACQTANASSPGREATESTMSQQLSVGDDSLGSWSNLSFEDEPPDDNSSFLHLSDSSNGNSSSWSSLGLEGDVCDEHLSFSPSDSDCTEDKETEVREESLSGTMRVVDSRIQVQAPRALLVVVNSDVRELGHDDPLPVTLDPQLRSMLQWAAASMVDLPQVQLSVSAELQQLPTVVQRLREREWRVGELLQALLRYCEENQAHHGQGLQPRAAEPHVGRGAPHQHHHHHHTPLFQWLLEHA